MEYISVKPAYGRDYKSQRAVLEAFDSNHDFEITSLNVSGGKYINKLDLQRIAPGAKLVVRYAKLTKQVVIGAANASKAAATQS